MEAGVQARLTAAEGRKFGLTVGLAFVALGLILVWRGKMTRADIILGIGGVFILAALAIPTYLGPVERAWMGLAHLISKVTTPIFMGIVYFVVITPMGFLRGLGGKSMTAPKDRGTTRWEPHTAPADVVERMERQF